MLTLVLTRHGLTDRSLPEQHLGQRLDVSINAAGRRQAEALRDRLRDVPFDRVVTSPLFRARETAEIVAAGTPLTADPRLREMDYGRWEGRTYDEIEAEAGRYRRRWEATPDVLACPDGESGNDVALRVRACLADLIAEASAPRSREGGTLRTVLLVGHATTSRILLCVAVGVPVRDYRRRFVQGQASLTVLRYGEDAGPEDATLLLLNDVAHLRARDELPWG
jgi:broad specificity phosphatase PhoE